jgi:L-cysteine S-thiosulfotransferase
MRAVPYAYGTPEMTELELFLARRAQGLTLEIPAVRP